MTAENGRNGVVSAGLKLGNSLISALPPAFLLLALINVAFLGMVLWFINSQITSRTQYVENLINRCMDLHTPGRDLP
jgi:hypothetical protein